ncbi:DUF262 domain-containing protein [Clostridium beijerinckii]|uniref:DUF262 domain-containing protein n=1 Tax=Clostridium beijerinckii TaxID=1520 RepID=UPI00242DC377|nr:DUF262 domain-containing protein [Clostridium beijerinckii]MDG5855648.1 DUF262 domain-containing protein [Clostridium beijerinckii]
MKYKSSDPDLETIVKRIKKGTLNLQPDFQRGEVWTPQRKKKLIDTLLRGWQIPPIHVIEVEDSNINEVLDGQQRLVAIRDFFNNKIRIDGNIEPYDEVVHSYNNMHFSDLPENIKSKLEEMSIRIFAIYEYTSEETAELFYRLNQPVSLTSAEQRNAFYGKAREQIKILVNIIDKDEELKKVIGFSNSRMAYDDIISKFCYVKQIHSLKIKISSNDIAKIYRDRAGFDENAIESSRIVVEKFASIIKEISDRLKLNKATVFSWICFISRYSEEHKWITADDETLGIFLKNFEEYRRYVKNTEEEIQLSMSHGIFNDDISEKLVLIFNQKCSMGSTDVSSIIARDVILWFFYYKMFGDYIIIQAPLYTKMKQLEELLYSKENITAALDEFIKLVNWGDI